MGGLRIFVLSAAIALGSGLLLGLLSLPLLKHSRFQSGQIQSFGGILPLFACLIGLLVMGRGGNKACLPVLLFMLLFAAVGFGDAGKAMMHPKGRGFSPLMHWLLLGILSLATGLFLEFSGYGFMSPWLYIPLAAGLVFLPLFLLPKEEDRTELCLGVGSMELLCLGLLCFLFATAAPLNGGSSEELLGLCTLSGSMAGGLLGFGVFVKAKGLLLGSGGLYALCTGCSMLFCMLPNPLFALPLYLLPLLLYLLGKLPHASGKHYGLLLSAGLGILSLMLYLL